LGLVNDAACIADEWSHMNILPDGSHSCEHRISNPETALLIQEVLIRMGPHSTEVETNDFVTSLHQFICRYLLNERHLNEHLSIARDRANVIIAVRAMSNECGRLDVDPEDGVPAILAKLHVNWSVEWEAVFAAIHAVKVKSIQSWDEATEKWTILATICPVKLSDDEMFAKYYEQTTYKKLATLCRERISHVPEFAKVTFRGLAVLKRRGTRKTYILSCFAKHEQQKQANAATN